MGSEPQWVMSKNRTEVPPGVSHMRENFLAGMEVFVKSDGQHLPGPTDCFLGEYEGSNSASRAN